MTDLDRLVMDIEERIREHEKKKYSSRVLKEAKDPHNLGRIMDPDGHATIKGPCGDTMEFTIRVEDGRMVDVRFMTDGCGSSIACGSITTSMAQGKTLEEASRITQQLILDELGGLPDENRHCAKLASDTLQKAILHYLKKER